MSQSPSPPVSLSRLLRGFVQVPNGLDKPIAGLANDSHAVREGDLFLATRGLRHHGLEFFEVAREKGAAAVVWEPPFPGRITEPARLPMWAVADLSRKLSILASRFYGEPARDLGLIGVTGTDGKTSCAHFIAQSLGRAGRHCGVLGTLGYGFPHDLAPTSHTTPDALTLQCMLADLRTRGASHVAMEVSSHALTQGRVAELPFSVAVLTNLGRDHLDYHGDMNAYRAAKRRLFFDNRPRCAVVNLDDAFGGTLAEELRGRIPVVGYGFQAPSSAGCDAFVRGEHLALTRAGLRMTVTSSWGQGAIRSRLIGDFNGANLLAVLGVLLALDIPFAEALGHVAEVSTVPGRMECFGGQAGKPLVVVDYAHTPQALEQALKVLRRLCQGQLWCVFGCGGERDPGKRPLMGACAERFADHVIITDDNPRGEDAREIIEAIRSGMKHPDAPRVIRDRQSAITRALAESAGQDVVLIAGKGHEDYQLVGTRRVAVSDRDSVRQWMAENP